MSSKTAFLFGSFNLNALDYDTNISLKTFSMWFFKMDSYPLSKDLQELKSKLRPGIIKAMISNHFPIFTVLRKNETYPLETSELTECDTDQ